MMAMIFDFARALNREELKKSLFFGPKIFFPGPGYSRCRYVLKNSLIAYSYDHFTQLHSLDHEHIGKAGEFIKFKKY